MAAISGDRTIPEELLASFEPSTITTGSALDRVAGFKPAILAIRGGTTVISVVLAAPAFVDRDWQVIAWCAVIIVYNIVRLAFPIRYVTADTSSLLRVMFEVSLHVTAVVATGYWMSPLVFALITAVMVAGFARGFGFALRIGLASAAAVSIPYVVGSDPSEEVWRETVQWTAELVLVAMIAGYARRVTGEVDRQHTLALDRLGRLADANLLLHSLHNVTQTLPASLDLDDALDTTMGRLRDLFDFDGAAVLLMDETDKMWVVARWEGPRPARTYTTDALPAATIEALESRAPVMVDQLMPDQPGLAVEMRSGLYAPLLARDTVLGLITLEHKETHHFKRRDQELMHGFMEPAALAIDNARWFARLRTVGADEERTRIARDLHDRIGQSLAYLAFELDRIVKTNSKGDDVTKHLDRLRTDVRGVIGEVRDTLYDLRTEVTDESDLSRTLEEFLDRVRTRSDLDIRLDVQSSGRLPLLQERELWRMAQEAVINVERHARATKVAVTWRCDGSRAVLIVADDGVGFPAGRAGRLDSYGILGMRERAASIGASLEISSEVGIGTTVRAEIRPT
ncbi:MAG: GAF domain-containing sensor histidine kinase [Microthrixaceae bacterium]|nr:GAF domain-containing sensor histidine kinase [Acidimicrobiales bacterium]MCB9404672.1 GAF domain-containing sensor histidine kinase [Microthrixaceae bacterium]